MNWLKTHFTKNNVVWLTGIIAGGAAMVAAFPATAGIALPAAIVTGAVKVTGVSTAVGMLAMKFLPGHGDNAPTQKQ